MFPEKKIAWFKAVGISFRLFLIYQLTRDTQINCDEFFIYNHYMDMDSDNLIQKTSSTKKKTFLSIWSIKFQDDLIDF